MDLFKTHLQDILERVKEYLPGFDASDIEQIEKAFWFAEKAHKGQVRQSGEPYFLHPVEATKILLSIKPDIETIQTCLLHDVLEDTETKEEALLELFGHDVLRLCQGVSKVAKVHLDNNASTEKGLVNIQKLFMAVAEDIRVLFVKIADRIHNLQTLGAVPEYKQKRTADESLKIYAPVCDKLGLHLFKDRIEDLSFRYQNPTMYLQIEEDIKAFKHQKERVFELARQDLLKLFSDREIEVLEITSRQKNIYSVYQKMKRKNLTSGKEMFDIVGFRILVPTNEDCYRVLGRIHSQWHPMPGRFKDYVGVPRANGYQSLHTTVLGLGKSKLPTEIQIKTPQMNMDAEYGPAAHWAYKMTKGSHFDENYLRRAEWFPDHIKQGEDLDPQEFYSHVARFLFRDRVIVFTPKGEIKTLVMGATPVDFAYAIHSEVGAMCAGAVVNGEIKPLDYVLKNGDIVNILTKQGKQPNPEWLKFVKTRHAREYIQSYVNKQKTKLGEDVVVQPSKDIFEQKAQRKTKPVRSRKGVPPQKTSLEVIIGGHRDIPHHFASCCKSKIGKKIIAYKNRGLDYAIHRMDCAELEKLDPDRYMEAYFCVRRSFETKAYSKIGLLRKYMALLGKYDVNILYSETTVDRDTNISHSVFTIEISSQADFENLLQEAKTIYGVMEVSECEEKVFHDTEGEKS